MGLELVNHIHGHPNDIFIGSIISDDDSVMCASLKNVRDGDKLPDYILAPTFFPDVSHRIKSMSAPVFKMAQKS